MIDEKPRPDLRAWMDFNPGKETDDLRNQARNKGDPQFRVQEMGNSVPKNGVKSRINEQHLQKTKRGSGGRVSLKYSPEVFNDRKHSASPFLKNVLDSLPKPAGKNDYFENRAQPKIRQTCGFFWYTETPMTEKQIDQIVLVLKKSAKHWVAPSVTAVADHTKDPFRILISTLLSLRTKDRTTTQASERLFKVATDPKKMVRLRPKQIERLIFPVGFYRTKARRIIEICRTLLEQYNGKVPGTMEELLKLKGVGRKTANLVVTLGFGKLGICVDTHVHRISNRLGLVHTKNPNETEFALMKILPKNYWIIYNDLLVSFGQNVCTPLSPWCSKCPIKKYCGRVGVLKAR